MMWSSAADLLQPITPDDAALKEYFKANLETYHTPDLLTFTHVFVDPDKRDDRIRRNHHDRRTKVIAD